MNTYKLLGVIIIFTAFGLSSCEQFLDVVPDNVATLDNAFTRRNEAEKYLFTCYSYMLKNGDVNEDPGMVAGDELWRFAKVGNFMQVAKGFQNTVNPYGDRWGHFFRAIRDCNIFLENIEDVPDLDETERRRWIGEVKFLKSYYQFYLVKMYGPIPLMKKNLPIDATEDEISVSRAPVDSCFNYITQLLDEASGDLPLTIADPARELGRITRPIALAFKAKVMVYAASPLFNGNTDAAELRNPDGTQLFNTSFSSAKWDSAVVACKRAIEMCHQQGLKLYEFPQSYQQFNLTDFTQTQMSIRNSVCEGWNSGIIWANTQTNTTSLQNLITTPLDPTRLDNPHIKGELSPPLKIAELFYTENGVPIDEDKTWDYANRYSEQTSEENDNLRIREGYTSAALNFDREPRFYANLGFDGSVWYGQGHYDDSKPSDLLFLEARFKQRNGFGKVDRNTVTGYYIKKLVHFENVIGPGGGNSYSVTPYFFTIMRLADLYLLYAEALNESGATGPEVYEYINLVRQRAGLESVEESWSNYSSNPAKYQSQEGMRDIIRQERLIELSFEGHRFWDLRRWKEAATQLNMPVRGWDLMQEEASAYYRPTVVYNQTFGMKDYFWPIDESTLSRNSNLVQNLGW